MSSCEVSFIHVKWTSNKFMPTKSRIVWHLKTCWYIPTCIHTFCRVANLWENDIENLKTTRKLTSIYYVRLQYKTSNQCRNQQSFLRQDFFQEAFKTRQSTGSVLMFSGIEFQVLHAKYLKVKTIRSGKRFTQWKFLRFL